MAQEPVSNGAAVAVGNENVGPTPQDDRSRLGRRSRWGDLRLDVPCAAEPRAVRARHARPDRDDRASGITFQRRWMHAERDHRLEVQIGRDVRTSMDPRQLPSVELEPGRLIGTLPSGSCVSLASAPIAVLRLLRAPCRTRHNQNRQS